MHKEIRKGKLVLKDGSVYEGLLYGGKRNAVGEVCFTTGMSGYQETLTDPSLLEERTVTLGVSDGQYIQVTGGLAEGDTVAYVDTGAVPAGG